MHPCLLHHLLTSMWVGLRKVEHLAKGPQVTTTMATGLKPLTFWSAAQHHCTPHNLIASCMPHYLISRYLHCYSEHTWEYKILLPYLKPHNQPLHLCDLLFKTSCDSIVCARYWSSPLCTASLKATAQRDYDCFFDGEILPLARQLKVFQTRRLSTQH